MKKLFLAAIMICFSSLAIAQEISKNTIGIRLGDSDGFGTEVSYQRALGQNNRLEAGLGWRNSKDYDAFKLSGIYQWVWSIDNNFNWYAGAGGGLASWKHDSADIDGTGIFVAGDVGIEYNFDFPLLISLDIRPELGFNDDYNDDLDMDLAIGVRYQF